jgi:hypothetical protein
MALNLDAFKTNLSAKIKEAFVTNGASDDSAHEAAAKEIASAIAETVDEYVKTATVTVTASAGQIAVEGSASAQTNVTPIVIEGNLS